MYKEIEVNSNLYFLQYLLFTLENCKFDNDITKILEDLKSLLDKKLWSNISLENYDIVDENVIVKFYLKK